MNEIIVALIAAGAALLGSLVTAHSTTNKMILEFRTAQAVTETKIDTLTKEVSKHNGFAERIPILEEQVRVANHRIADLEKRIDV